MPSKLQGESRHEIEAYVIDFRSFDLKTKVISNIISDAVDTGIIADVIGNRRIKQLDFIWNNLESNGYELELVVLISCMEIQGLDPKQSFEMFGAVADGQDIVIYTKQLTMPIGSRQEPVIGFLRSGKGENLIIFEDGEIVPVKSSQNYGVTSIKQNRLDLPFDKANRTLWDPVN